MYSYRLSHSLSGFSSMAALINSNAAGFFRLRPKLSRFSRCFLLARKKSIMYAVKRKTRPPSKKALALSCSTKVLEDLDWHINQMCIGKGDSKVEETKEACLWSSHAPHVNTAKPIKNNLSRCGRVGKSRTRSASYPS